MEEDPVDIYYQYIKYSDHLCIYNNRSIQKEKR